MVWTLLLSRCGVTLISSIRTSLQERLMQNITTIRRIQLYLQPYLMTKQWPKLAIHGQAKCPADLGIMNKARTFFPDNGG